MARDPEAPREGPAIAPEQLSCRACGLEPCATGEPPGPLVFEKKQTPPHPYAVEARRQLGARGEGLASLQALSAVISSLSS